MATKKDATPPAPPVEPEATKPEATEPEATTPEPSPWDDLQPVVAMPNKTTPGDFKVNVLESVHAAIRERAEASLAINAKRVADKAGSNAKRARVDYHWDVQPFTLKPTAEGFVKQLAKYARYRPSTGDIPFKAENSPMGQVTCRTGDITWYKTGADGVPTACAATDDGAYLGLRFSVRPLEQRGGSKRLPGTA